MISAAQQRDWLEQQIALNRRLQPADNPSWLAQAREQARQALGSLPALNRRQEAWRYTSVEGLLQNDFYPTTAADESALWSLAEAECLAPAMDAHRLVFINGRCVPQLCDTGSLPPGVRFGSLRDALAWDTELLGNWFGRTANHTEHVFTALNTVLLNDGVFLHLDADVVVDRPFEILYVNGSEDALLMMQPRNLVVLQQRAKATLVERFVSSAQSLYFHNNLNEISVSESASLSHYRLQDESREAYHLSSLYLSQRRDSVYRAVNLAFGGAWSRTDIRVDFQQPGADCQLSGLYTAGDGQLSDIHLDVRHSVPGCSSSERFKGILQGRGRAVFDGRILVDRDAQQSDAHLSNDNLMLSRSAEVDTKPQLEIYADDVKCSHGTTVGQLDPQQLFYLRSRGLDEAAARKMLCLGFAGEIIDDIDLQPLHALASARLEQTLSPAVGR